MAIETVSLAEGALREFIKDCEFAGVSRSMIDVIKERGRQVSEEGYDSQHDDEHTRGGIAISAIAYIQGAHQRHLGLTDEELSVFWYFDSPLPNLKKEPRELLVKAAAMLIAEIDRIDRAAAARQVGHGG